MKILVFSDSHSSPAFMQRCISAFKPDRMVHLGDYYNDCNSIRTQNRWLPIEQTYGNCDFSPEERAYRVVEWDGIKIFMTHGHRFRVKQDLYPLLKEARAQNADVAMFGHTHIPHCTQEEDGLWVLNPGAAGGVRCTAGLLEIQEGSVTACRIIRQAELENME